MATNDFIGFASSGSANIMSQADYAAAAEQSSGVQPGMASSRLANKAWRQGANMAAVIGELIKNHGNDALDNGDLTTLYSALLSATASPTLAGLMSAADKTKLDGLISTDATPTAAGYMSGADKTKLDGLISTDATPTAAGYMSAEDKAKLDGLISTGTWTPVLAGSTTPGAFVYGSNTAGQYIKIGSLVYVHGFIVISSYTTYPAGYVMVNGLPYIAAYDSMLFNTLGNGASVNDSFSRFCGASTTHNTSHINLRINNAHPSATTQGQVSYANWFQGATDYYGVEYSSGNANIMIDGIYVAL